MSETSQFGLLTKKRLLPLFVTQFFGAFNDNIFKSALTVIFVFSLLVPDEQEDLYVNLATALLILPLFLFSATAGTLADHYEEIETNTLCEDRRNRDCLPDISCTVYTPSVVVACCVISSRDTIRFLQSAEVSLSCLNTCVSPN